MKATRMGCRFLMVTFIVLSFSCAARKLPGPPAVLVVMHAGGDLNPRADAVTPAKLHGRQAEGLAKGAAERFVGFISRLEGDLHDRRFGELEPASRAFQSQPPHMAAQRFPQHSSEHMMKMMRRKAGQPGEFLQGQRLVEVLLDMHQHAQEALLVESQRGRLWPRSFILRIRLTHPPADRLTVFAIFQGARSSRPPPSASRRRNPSSKAVPPAG